ncbi:2-dehydropantoate 2-reductase [Leifsonia lichenia]
MHIIGAGAIGGTIGALMTLDGHDVTLCDADAAHVDAINRDGLRIEGPVNEFTVRIPAILPDQLPAVVDRAIVAVKSHHTGSVADLLAPRLAEDGYVLTVQNGLTADILTGALGRDRVVSSFVNFGADVMGPGRIMQGNVATFRVGELDGGRITPRVRELADALPYAEATDNVLGYLWGKEAYGAMLWAGAVSDLSIADSLEDPRYRPVMIAIASEVLAQAPVTVESFDGFVPDDLEGSLDRLAAFNRRSAKTHSGIYRDLTVRKRKTEIDEMLRDVDGPIFRKVGDIIHDIENGDRVCETANLDELADFVSRSASSTAQRS